MGACDGCHPEEHEDGFRELCWSRLETALISPSIETDPKRKYQTYCGMYNWVKKYDSENHSRRWELLEKQFDAAIPGGRSQSLTIQEMIRWVQKFDSSNLKREWDLLERWRDYSEQDEDPRQLQKVLLRMSRWVEDNDSENSEKLWGLLVIRYTSGGNPFLLGKMKDLRERKFPQNKKKIIQLFDFQFQKDESNNDLKSQSINLQETIEWFEENAPEESNKIWDLLEKKLSVEERAGNRKGMSISLTKMIVWLQNNAPEEPERIWVLLENKISVDEAQNSLLGQSIVLNEMISWLEQNAPEDPQRVWNLLERKHEIDSQSGHLKSLGMNLQRMINWSEINAPEDPQRVWNLLERKNEIDSQSGDLKSLGMNLQRMGNWILLNDPETPQRYWDILVKILSNSIDQDYTEGISISRQRMVNWLKEHDPENLEMIWDLVEDKIVNEFEKDGNKGISMMLREMSRLLQEFDIKGKRKTRFDEFIHEFLERIENVGDILELSVSLWNTGESLPSEIYDRFDDNDNLDKFVERWCRTFAPLPLEGWILSPEYSNIIPNIEIYISEEMTNLSQLRITNNTSGIKPSEIQDWAVLDLPNILGWGVQYSSLDSNALDKILNEAELLFERTYVYLTPTTLSKYEEIVRSLIERNNVEILIGNSDTIEINEDWIFLSFAMIHGCHIVSNDNFTQEIESSPNIEEFLEKSKLSFRWWKSDSSFSIAKIRNLDYLSEENSELSDDERSITNLCMKIVYDYYGPEFYSENIHHISFDFDSGTLEIHPRRKESIGKIIGSRGRPYFVGELSDLFRDKFESVIPIKVVLPTD